jgi:anaerobic selenocysteine-containing dehydrogenase
VFETGNYDLALNRFAIHTVARWNEPVLPMPSDGRDDWQIALELALRLRAPRPLRGPLRRVLSRLPEAAIDWMLRLGPHRLSRRKLRLHLHGLDLGPPTPRGFLGRGRDRRANLAPDVLIGDFSRLVGWLGETRPTLVLIGRRHVRSDNSWLHNLPSMTKGPDRSHLWMHGADATARELHDGDLVIARSRTGAVEVSLRVCDDLMPGVVSLPHGFGHRAALLRVASALPGGNVNALTDELLIEPLIGTSILNGVPVEVVGASRLRSPRADRGST